MPVTKALYENETIEMLDLIQRLINEHGSSSILKERLELINDKYEILEAKLKNSEDHNSNLKKENEMLKKKCEEYEAEIHSQSNDNAYDLNEKQKELLILLFRKPDGEIREKLISSLGCDQAMFQYHIEKLQEYSLVGYPIPISGNPMGGTKSSMEYRISPSGRTYVVEKLGVI